MRSFLRRISGRGRKLTFFHCWEKVFRVFRRIYGHPYAFPLSLTSAEGRIRPTMFGGKGEGEGCPRHTFFCTLTLTLSLCFARERGSQLLRRTPAFAFIPLFFFVLVSCSKSEAPPPAVVEQEARVEAASRAVDQIVLKSGGMIEGEIVEQTPAGVLLRWGGGTVRFEESEISEIHRGISPSSGSPESIYLPKEKSFYGLVRMWPKGTTHLVFLKNGEWVSGTITAKNDRALTVRKILEEGGAVELDLDLNQIEKIELWPFPKERAAKRLAGIKAFFPDLNPLEFGHYHILAGDQSSPEFKRFLRALDQIYYDWILFFFPLLKHISSIEPLDVLVLGARSEFARLLKEAGAGLKKDSAAFYQLKERKLVFYNKKSSSELEKKLQQAREIHEKARQARLKGVKRVHSEDDEIKAQELKILGRAYLQTLRAIRREAAHQLFHVLGILPQDIYAGGWLSEGLAVFCETDPIGTVHDDHLMYLRYQMEQGGLLPLSHVLGFGRGSEFHRMDPYYANLAYAESWAFIYFLMDQNRGYRGGFLKLIGEIRSQSSAYDADQERLLLERHLGKRLSEIEADFTGAVKELIGASINEARYEEFKSRILKNL